VRSSESRLAACRDDVARRLGMGATFPRILRPALTSRRRAVSAPHAEPHRSLRWSRYHDRNELL